MLIDLDRGVYLEDRGVPLAWDSSPDELRRLTRPGYCVGPRGPWQHLTLAWNDRVLGLRCQVTTSFPPGRLSLRGVWLVFLDLPEMTSTSAAFGWVNLHLGEHFGPPLSTQEDGEQGETRWAVGGVGLRHEYFEGMGGGHYLFVFPRKDNAQPDTLTERPHREHRNA